MPNQDYKSKECFIIAEIGMNHDGSFGIAKAMIDTASKCGVNAVKLQTHIAEAETLPVAPMPPYFHDEPRYEYFQRTAFNNTQWELLKRHTIKRGVEFLSSPFSIEAVDILEKVGIDKYKIPSGEVTNIPFLEAISQTKKPILLSSGMSSWAELDEAVNTILQYHDHVTVLQCTSAYPCPYEKVGLNLMLEMHERYNLPVGLSDHSITNYASFAAVTLGASVVEKHFTLSRQMYGSDAKHSLEPLELKDLVDGIRAIEVMLRRKMKKDVTPEIETMKQIFEKSVVTLVDIPKGESIERNMLGCKKPGTGIPTKRLSDIIGCIAVRNIPKNCLLSEDDYQ